MAIGNVICEDAYEENGVLFFALYKGNSLYAYDKENSNSVRIGDLYEKSRSKAYRMCEAITKIDNKIIIGASSAEAMIIIYDLSDCSCVRLEVSKYVSDELVVGIPFKFCKLVPYGRYVYCIGKSYPAILKIDIDKFEISVITKAPSVEKWSFSYIGVVDKYLLLAYEEKPIIIKINMDDDICEDIIIDGDLKGFSDGIVLRNGDIYALESCSSRIAHLNSKGDLTEILTIDELPDKENDRYYFESMLTGKCGFFLFPVRACHVYFFDFIERKFYKIKELDSIYQELSSRDMNRRVFSFSTRENYVYAIGLKQKKWYEICLLDFSYKSFQVSIAVNGILETLKRGMVESNDFSITCFVEAIKANCVSINEIIGYKDKI